MVIEFYYFYLLGSGNNYFCTAEEYNEFITNLFANVDDNDRDETREVTKQTAGTFLLVGELIDVLEAYGELTEEWMKTSNF